jgi:hypothetical protein
MRLLQRPPLLARLRVQAPPFGDHVEKNMVLGSAQLSHRHAGIVIGK